MKSGRSDPRIGSKLTPTRRCVSVGYTAEQTVTAGECPVSGLMYADVSPPHDQHRCTYRFLAATASSSGTDVGDADGRRTQCFNASALAGNCGAQGTSNGPPANYAFQLSSLSFHISNQIKSNLFCSTKK